MEENDDFEDDLTAVHFSDEEAENFNEEFDVEL